MTRTIEQIRAAFQNQNQGGTRFSNFYPFYQIPFDSKAVVRFLPDKNPDNSMGFLLEKVVHTLDINGSIRTTPCLSMFGEECPICQASQRFYKAGDDVMGANFWKKRQYLAQALIIEDPLPKNKESGETHEGKVRILNLKAQIFNIIKNAISSGELDEIPYSYKGGYNFIIMRSQQGDFPNYTFGSNFARKQSDLDDEVIAYVEEQLIDLSTLLPSHPGLEKTEALLNAALTGEEYTENGISSKKDDDDYTPPRTRQKLPVDEPEEEVVSASKSAKVSTSSRPEPAVADDEEDDASEDILAKIRSRRKSKPSE